MTTPIPSMTGGAGGSASSGSSGGMLSAGGVKFDNSGFTVNYAPSLGVGSGVSPWLILGAALVGLWLWRRK